MSTRIAQLTAAALVSLAAVSAAAHGDVPLPESFSGVAGGDGEWVLQTNFGVMTSGERCRYVCEEAFNGGDRFSVAAFEKDEWVVFTEDKIVRTSDGCDFREIRSLPDTVADWAIDRSSGRLAFILGSGADRGIWMSDDRGKSFAKMKVDKPNLKLTTLEFLDGGGLAVAGYVSGSAGSGSRGAARFFVADNPGEVREISGFQYPHLLAAHGDRILWLGRNTNGQVVVWGSIDSPVGTRRRVDAWPSGALISEEGGEIWVSGVEKKSRGLLHGTVDGDSVSWEIVESGHSATCIGYAGDSLHVCGKMEREGWDLQRRTDSGELDGLVNFEKIAGPRSNCPAESDVGSTCPAVWPEFARSLDVDPERDPPPFCAAGGERADAGGGLDAGSSNIGGSSCTAAGGGRPVGGLITLFLVGLFLGRRRG